MSDVTAAPAPDAQDTPAAPEATAADTAQAPANDGPVSEQDWLQRRKEARSQPAPVEDTPAEDAEPSDDATDEDTQAADGGDAPQTESPEQQDETASEDTTEGDFPETVNALAEALGFEPGEFAKGLTAQVTIDGETHDVPLEEALKGYQRREDYDRSKGALVEERKALEAERASQAQELDARIKQAEAVALALQQQFSAGPDDARLAELAQTDPYAWAEAKQARDAQAKSLQQAQMFLAGEYQKRQEHQAKSVAEYRTEQQQKLAAKLPDVNDPTKLAALEKSITATLTDHYGYTPEEIREWFGGSFDHRMVLVARDLAAMHEATKAAKPVKQKLQKLRQPKAAAQGRTERQKAGDGVRSARQRLRSSNSVQDAMALLKAQRAARSARDGGGKPQNHV